MKKESIRDTIIYDHRCDYEAYDFGASIGLIFGFLVSF